MSGHVTGNNVWLTPSISPITQLSMGILPIYQSSIRSIKCSKVTDKEEIFVTK